ncbi:MAG: DmsE family decaheme c-type cytochrome [Betaproteobacteria bacterium]|nr:DmsE family decaheme c-type cytochrome [Betaproteobacteria bacterium]
MRFKTIIAATGILAALAAFAALPALAQAAREASSSTPICVNCHEKAVKTTMLTAHGARNDVSGAACQACHGDAALHAKDPLKNKPPANALNAKDATAAEKSGVCLTCHSSTRALAAWSSGQHRKNDVSCNDCHSIHGTPSASNDKMLKVTDSTTVAPYVTTARQLAYKTCLACHADVRGDIMKPSHHPIVEGKVACHDCHDPHGALTPVMLKAESYQDLCISCHADKRGPWIHEHPPVMENCATCHTPHGSSHGKLLAQKPPALCADCHPGGHTHGIYDGRGTLPGVNPGNIRFEGSGCVACHRQIHGSNAPASAFGQFFVR